MRAVEDVVAEGERHPIRADELAADDERLRQPFGLGLGGVFDLQAELRAVTEQTAEAVLLVGRRDHEDGADPGQHQRRQRVVHHRLVVDREQLLADRAGHRMEPRAGAAGENDALHRGSGTADDRPTRVAVTERQRSPGERRARHGRGHARCGRRSGRAVSRATSASTIIWTSRLKSTSGFQPELLLRLGCSRRSGDRLRPGGGSAGSSSRASASRGRRARTRFRPARAPSALSPVAMT